jgi:DNA polymerase-3 subunit delta'
VSAGAVPAAGRAGDPLAAALEAARAGRLYPSVILHGGDPDRRRDAALALARTLLCDAAPAARPCGACRHCRRVVWPGGGDAFHPDFQVLERDLKTATSVDATRELLRTVQLSPFEARGQTFAVAAAETLTGEAANALLKALEEPPMGAPRHFLLLAPSQYDLLPTLRSRSLAIYLGAIYFGSAGDPDAEPAAEPAGAFARAITGWAESGAAVWLLAAAGALHRAGAAAPGGWDDVRSGRPWSAAAAAALAAARAPEAPRRALLELAEELLAAPALRLRGIPAERILEGLVCRVVVPVLAPKLLDYTGRR